MNALIDETLKELVEFFRIHGAAALAAGFTFTKKMLEARAARVAKLIFAGAKNVPVLCKRLKTLAASPSDDRAKKAIRPNLASLLAVNPGLRAAIGREIDQSQTTVQQYNHDQAKGTVITGNVGEVNIS